MEWLGSHRMLHNVPDIKYNTKYFIIYFLFGIDIVK